MSFSLSPQGQRQKRLQARRIREEKEEEERQAIDIEEAQFQAQKRKEAIEKAKTQQYYQTDRVKGFHVSILTENRADPGVIYDYLPRAIFMGISSIFLPQLCL